MGARSLPRREPACGGRPRPTNALRAALLLVGGSLVVGGLADRAAAQFPADRSHPIHDLVTSDPSLRPTVELAPMAAVESELPEDRRLGWQDFEAAERVMRGPWQATVDRRSGLVHVAEGAGVPWIPGHGNDLEVADLAGHLWGRAAVDLDTLESLARSFVTRVEPLLGTAGRVLVLDREISGPYSDYLWIVEFDVYAAEGLEIEGARVFFRINHGNLVQWGSERLPPPGTLVPPILYDREEARSILQQYLAPAGEGSDWWDGRGTLKLIPMASDASGAPAAVGEGYGLRPVWELGFRREGLDESWRARVDATTGQVVELVDTNRYSQVTGGYWPVAWKLNGLTVNQTSTGWPFTTINPLGATSNTSGLYSWDGNPQTAYHTGPFVTISDACAGAPGTASSDASGNIDFGTFNPPNPTTPGDCTNQLGIGDNTPAARQQYWHVNKIKEKARSYFPANAWLQANVTANVNINLTCNAFWNGVSLNFYRTNGACYNLGANAGVSMHEWGHGMDSNDGNGSSIDNGTGETYGDFSAALQTLNSCVGNGIFVSGVCGGYGNPCVAGGCDGVRDIDWGRHTANVPMTVASFTQPTCPSDAGGGYNGPCGDGAPQPDDKEGHCESYVSSGALWDFAAADLQSGCTGRNAAFPDYNCPGAGGPYNSAGAWGVVDRLWYLSRPSANMAFTCSRATPIWTSDGCNAGSNWRTMRLVDDDDGNLANGTPHSCQLAAAFERHDIACTFDTNYDVCFRGCPQPAAPTLDPPGVGNNQLTLTWTPDTTPDVVDVFRNEAGCGFGFAKIAEDVSFASLPYVDNEVANGTTYYYQVVRHPVDNEACGSAPSNCVSAAPVLGPSAKYVTDSATLIAVPTDNDGDGFVDNCETGRIQVGIVNDGAGALTNVRFTVTSADPAISIPTAMPVVVGNLAVSTQTTGTFDFDVDGASCGDAPNFVISVTADEMTGSNPDNFAYGPLEQDLALVGSQTDDFETGDDGWTFTGLFARENVTAASGVWSVHSSSGLDDQDDRAVSPVFQKGAGATSAVIAVRHDIENPFWDRANVHAVRLSDGSHNLLTPTGETYTPGGPWNPVGHVGTEPGWAGVDLSWGDATFDLSGLVAGESYQLEITYATDQSIAGTGFWFDNVRWTNVSFQVCDGQSDLCVPCTPPNAPTGLLAVASAANQISLSWNPVAPAPSNYRIYRSTSSGGPYTQVGSVGGGTLTFDDTGLTEGVTYYYVVRAFEICESADSNEASDTAFGDCTTPPTFAGLTSVSQTSSGGSCGLRLAWLAGTNNCNTEPVVYNVYRSTTSGFTPDPTPGTGNLLQSCVTTEFYDDTAVIGGTTYFYIVRAEDDALGGGGPCQDGNEEGNSGQQSGAPPSGAPVLLHDQTAGTTTNGMNSQNYGDFPAFANERGVDFLVPAGGWTISSVFIDGFYPPLEGPTPSIDVRFYADNGGGVPLSLPVNAAIPACTYSGLLPGADYVDTAGQFDITLPTACVLPPGRHWVSVVANMNFNPGGNQWFWLGVSAVGGSENAWRNPGNGFGSGCTAWSNGFTTCGSTDPDMAFQLWGPGTGCSVAPGAPQFLTATATDQQTVLEWLNPAAGGYGSTRIRWSAAGYPADPTDGNPLVDQNDGLGAKGTFTHGSLTNDTTYYYSAFVDNGSGEFSARKTVSARPFDTSGSVEMAYSTAASALAPPGIGSVYGVANDRVLHSMDTTTGTWPGPWRPLAMNGPAQDRPPIVPVAVGGATKVAFLGSHDGRVYAVDADLGSQIWASPVLGDFVQAAPAGLFTAFGGAYDLLLVGTRNAAGDNQLVALNLADGTVAWQYTNSLAQGGDDLGIGMISGAVSVDYATNRLYFASRQRPGGSADTVWGLSFTDTTVSRLWAGPFGDVDGSPILAGGRIYVGNNVGDVHALDPATGASLWAAPFSTGDGPVKGYPWPLFGTNEVLVSTTTTLWSIADNGASAALDWSVASIPSPSVPLAFDLGGGPMAWVGSSDGRLYQLDISAAPVITSVTLGAGTAAVGSPALSLTPTPHAYVGTEEGRIYSVSLPLP